MISQRNLEKVGTLGLFAFAAGALEKPMVSLVGFLVMLMVACATRRHQLQRVVRHPIFPVSIGFFLLVVLLGLNAYLNDTQNLVAISKWTMIYVAISGIPAFVVAVWLAGDRKTLTRTLNIALLALLVAILDDCEVWQIQQYLAGERAFFHLGNAAGLYLSTGVLGILLVALGEMHRHRSAMTLRRGSVIAYFIVVLAILCLAFIAHQNRSAWLASFVVFPVTLFAYIRSGLAEKISKRHYIALAVLLSLFIGALYLGQKTASQRFVGLYEVVILALDNEVDDLPKSSTRDRLKLWNFGIERFLERPILGHGPGSAGILLQQDADLARYPHLHNLFLHLLVETGVIGLLLYCLILLGLFKSTVTSRARGRLPDQLYYFVTGSLWLFVLINFGQIRVYHSHGIYYFMLMSALAIAYYRTDREASRVSDGKECVTGAGVVQCDTAQGSVRTFASATI